MRTVTMGYEIEKIWYMVPVLYFSHLVNAIPACNELAINIARKCFRAYVVIKTLSGKNGVVIRVERKLIEGIGGA